MPTYITLVKYTQQGAQTIKQLPQRLEAARKAAKAAGADFKQIYFVMGQYDAIAISEAPNDEAATKLVLGTAMQGNVTTQTLRAFTEAEFTKIVASLP